MLISSSQCLRGSETTHYLSPFCAHDQPCGRAFCLIQRMVSLASPFRQSRYSSSATCASCAKAGDADQWHAFAAPQARLFFRRRVKLRGAVLSARLPHVRRGIGAAQTGAKIMRIGDAIEDQKGRSCNAIDPADRFPDNAGPLHASDNTLMHGTVAFLVEILAVCQLDNHAPDSRAA